jgi:hypothetical protein
MKWTLLILVALAGLHALHAPADQIDPQAARVCGTDPTCARRHNAARFDALGPDWSKPVERFILWTPACPDNRHASFQACNDVPRQ